MENPMNNVELQFFNDLDKNVFWVPVEARWQMLRD
jgi:hypothetical protein